MGLLWDIIHRQRPLIGVLVFENQRHREGKRYGLTLPIKLVTSKAVPFLTFLSFRLLKSAIYGTIISVRLRTIRLPEFVEWFEDLNAKGRVQVDSRILKIETAGYFGDAKDLGAGLAELRWKSGRRVYFARVRDSFGSLVLLVLGGNKNGQTKDIRQARLLLRTYEGN